MVAEIVNAGVCVVVMETLCPQYVSSMGVLTGYPQCMSSLVVPTKPAMLLQNIVEVYKELML